MTDTAIPTDDASGAIALDEACVSGEIADGKQLGAAMAQRCSTPQSQVVMVPPPELPVTPICVGSTSGRVSR